MSENENEKSTGLGEVVAGGLAGGGAFVGGTKFLRKGTVEKLTEAKNEAATKLGEFQAKNAEMFAEGGVLHPETLNSNVMASEAGKAHDAAYKAAQGEHAKVVAKMEEGLGKLEGDALKAAQTKIDQAKATFDADWSKKFSDVKTAHLSGHESNEVKEFAKLEAAAESASHKLSGIENAKNMFSRSIATFKGMGTGAKVGVGLGAAAIGLGVGMMVNNWRNGSVQEAAPERISPEQAQAYQQVQQQMAQGQGQAR